MIFLNQALVRQIFERGLFDVYLCLVIKSSGYSKTPPMGLQNEQAGS